MDSIRRGVLYAISHSMNSSGESVALPQLETLLDNLEKKVVAAVEPAQKARVLNLAGDMCIDAVQLERGMSYYDMAITTLMAAAQYDAAAKICEKIIALKQNAVRPFYTLALLALHRSKPEAARDRIAQYVTAAEEQKLAKVARKHLLDLSEVSDDVDVLEAIAEGLMQLNDSDAANVIYGRILSASALRA